jgi:uncharacterized protein (TIGR03435 family)
MIASYPTITAHLWQSTLFAAAIGLLTLLLKRNPARMRYWVWLAALMKFLVPFGVLVSLGVHLGMPGRARKAPLVALPAISLLMGEMSERALPVMKDGLAPRQPTNVSLPAILFGVWACGFLVIGCRWVQWWMRVRADVRAASRLPMEIGIPVVSSPVLREPGVFGIFRPVLLLPAGMAEQLNEAEWKAILAHELCHARCYDNLTAAVYMLVETIFWFHPLVWWIGKRLATERELACDEEVLRLGSEPKVYAEGILKVCELYLESPLECVAGVTGSNLRRRIRAIMTHRGTEKVSMAKKLALAVAGMAAIALPVGVGMMNAPAIHAESAGKPSFEVATVKPSADGSIRAGPGPLPGGRVKATSVTLKMLMAIAYNVREENILGGPNWIATDRWNIEAKAEEGSMPPGGWPEWLEPDQPLTLMVQSLLEDRFQLKARRESKEAPVYELSVSKTGPKMKLSDDQASVVLSAELPQRGGSPPRGSMRLNPRAGYLAGNGMAVAKLAGILSEPGVLGRPVTDKTELKGLYDFILEWTPESGQGPVAPGVSEPASPTAISAPSIFTAIQEQLGLKVESAKGPVEVLIIDRVQKPTGN